MLIKSPMKNKRKKMGACCFDFNYTVNNKKLFEQNAGSSTNVDRGGC